jgi:RNA polymerase sporulation-specific sigma factor
MRNVAPLWLASALEEETDETLVQRAWQGEDLALSTLLQRYRSFVRVKARTYFLVGGDREDVVQEGMIGLYKAIRDYDASRQTSFRSFAELCVVRQIITAIKTATRQKHAPLNRYVSLYLPLHHEDDPDGELLDQVMSVDADPADRVVSQAELASLEGHFTQMLSDLEASVLERYIEGHSYAEIAAELDRHEKAIDNAIQRIKRKLEGYLTQRRLTEAV